MLQNSFIVDFGPHLPFITADRIPVELIAIDVVDDASILVPDARGAVAIDFHESPDAR